MAMPMDQGLVELDEEGSIFPDGDEGGRDGESGGRP